MPEPCRGCDRRDIDFGGCRCQAALLTGDAANTDPACAFSPFRATLLKVVESAESPYPGIVPLEFRGNRSAALKEMRCPTT
jgi:PqqA peptide cyclase